MIFGREELVERLTYDAPAGSRLRAVGALVEPALAIERSLGPSPSPVSSAFGGEPFTPRGFEWPLAPDGRAMGFIGQVNFAEVRAQAPSFDGPAPRRGLLQLFCADYYWRGPEAPDAGLRLLWHPRPEASLHRPRPARGPDRVRATMRFRPTWSAPDLWTLLPELQALDDVEPQHKLWLPEAEADARASYRTQIEGCLSSHQLFGHAASIQNDPRWTMALQRQDRDGDRHGAWARWYKENEGRLAFDDAGHVDDASLVALWQAWVQRGEWRALEAERDAWRLLWQLDTDDELGLFWGDLGRLFVMIRREDLARNDLAAARIEWQGH